MFTDTFFFIAKMHRSFLSRVSGADGRGHFVYVSLQFNEIDGLEKYESTCVLSRLNFYHDKRQIYRQNIRNISRVLDRNIFFFF